jgi:hypothetical protein
MHLYDFVLGEFQTDFVKDWYYSGESESDDSEIIKRLITAAHSLLTIETIRKNAMEYYSFERAYIAFNELYPGLETITQEHCKKFLRLMYIKS